MSNATFVTSVTFSFCSANQMKNVIQQNQNLESNLSGMQLDPKFINAIIRQLANQDISAQDYENIVDRTVQHLYPFTWNGGEMQIVLRRLLTGTFTPSAGGMVELKEIAKNS